LLEALVFGLLMTLAGALAPVLEATTVSPAAASRQAAYESRIVQASGKLALAGVMLGGLAMLAALQPAVDGLPLFGFASALFM
ncbi:hypothetical protein WB403_51345, partial [Streptomyces brasiliscabiei]